MSRILGPVLFACTLAAIVSVNAEEQSANPPQAGYRRTTLTFKTVSGEERKRQLDLWYPTDDKEAAITYRRQNGNAAKNAAVAAGKHPLILFSHGYLGGSDQSIFLTEACARAGYIVASMNHGDGIANVFEKKQDPPKFGEFAKWTDAKYRDRQEDVVALLGELLKWNEDADSPWSGRIDDQHVGGMRSDASRCCTIRVVPKP